MAAAYLMGSSAGSAFFCSKVSFPSRPEARRALKRMVRNASSMVAYGQGRLGTYKCGACHQFHIGHSR